MRHPIVLSATISSILLACSACAFALNPSLDASQYAHAAWKASDGFTKGVILAIAQTPDGYLWLGTEFGLYRFDGVRAIPWKPAAGQDLPSQYIYSLLVARDGTLWIGTDRGLASWKDGKLTHYPDLDGQTIQSLLEDREGTIWCSGEKVFSAPNICAIGNSGVHCYGKDGGLGGGWIVSLYEDRKGTLWALGGNGIWRWKPGPPKFYPLPIARDNLHGIAEDTAGRLLIGIEGGIRRFSDGKIEAYPLSGRTQPFTTRTLLRDRDGGLWIAVYHAGLVHVHGGRADVFRQADGLSSDDVFALFEDRENNVWVSTMNGLDRFRAAAVATFSLNEGLSNGLPRSVLADKDGSVLVATPGGLDRWREGQITTYDKRGGKLNGRTPTSLFQERSGRIWVSTTREIGYLENNRFVSVSSTYDGRMLDIAEDSAGNLWMADQQGGLLHLSGSKLVERIPWASLGHKDFALSLAADHLRGGIWLGFSGGGISHFADGHIQETYTAADGLGNGSVTNLQVEKDGTLWAATDGGLSRMKNGRFVTLARESGLPCNLIHWMIQDDDHSFWLYTPCGLVSLSRSEMDTWTAAADRNLAANQMVHPTVFDSADGVRVHELSYRPYNPAVTKSSDGKIWFVPLDGVSMIDPRHLPFNTLPPQVQIGRITADRKAYDPAAYGNGRVPLPARLRDLEIDYTALSFVAPEKVLFRYKLEGRDGDWRDAGNRRQAFYSDLPPGQYRFRVAACNNSGVWNEEGAFLNFSVAPEYYQTTWFRIMCAVFFLILLWGLYQLRLRQLQRQFNAGIEVRVNERTRIARELHDTLLQSFHGLMFQFQAARNVLPQRPQEAIQTLDSAINATEQAIAESRDAIHELRTDPARDAELTESLRVAAQELANSAQPGFSTPTFKLTLEGERKTLPPLLQDEIYRIAREVLRNAYQHANADRIEAEIRYEDQALRLRIRDNGKGIDLKVLKEGGSSGHWGLRGIRERAQRIGAQLDFWSEVGAGTEVQLNVPAAVVREAFGQASKQRLSRTGPGQRGETK